MKMSETQERETEFVAGVIQGITQKGADKWQVAVQPDGSNYAKNLWTKDADLVDSLGALIGQHRAFVCGVSHWTMNDGKQVRSLWINEPVDPGNMEDLHVQAPRSVATPAATAREAADAIKTVAHAAALKSGEGMSKEEWARKDSAIHKMACIKAAADALKHTVPSDPTPEDLNKFGERVFILAYRWHQNVLAERDDPTGEGVPF
jgi:hypothetical protein